MASLFGGQAVALMYEFFVVESKQSIGLSVFELREMEGISIVVLLALYLSLVTLDQ